MALPIAITGGWVSIILKVSPNSIAIPSGSNVKTGIISSVVPKYKPELAVDQYVLFKTKDDTSSVIYSNDTYYLIEEKDIIYIENPVV